MLHYTHTCEVCSFDVCAPLHAFVTFTNCKPTPWRQFFCAKAQRSCYIKTSHNLPLCNFQIFSCSDWDCNFVARLHKAFDGKARLYNCNCMQLSFDWIHFIQLSIYMVRVKINSNRNLKKDKEKPHKGYVYKLDRQQTMMLRFDQSQLLVWEYPSPQPLITSDQWSQKGRRMHAWRFLSQDLFAYLT